MGPLFACTRIGFARVLDIGTNRVHIPHNSGKGESMVRLVLVRCIAHSSIVMETSADKATSELSG